VSLLHHGSRHGRVVIQWLEPIEDLTITSTKDSICKGDTLTLIASGHSNYLWSPAASLSSDTSKTVIAAPTADITYQVISNYNNCKDTAQIQIVVHQLPNITLSPDSSVCKGDSLQINVGGANIYSWIPVTGLNVSIGTTVNAGPLVTTKYYVTGKDGNNCSATDSVTIIVDSLPIALITGISSVCAGDSTTITASGGGTYLWNTGSTNAAIKISPSSTSPFFVVVKNYANCIDSAMLTVIVHPLPTPQFYATNVCDGNSVNFTDLSTINTPYLIQSFNWNFGDGSFVNNNQNPSYLFASDSVFSVQLVVVSNFGCSDSISKIITINPNPIINFTADDTTACALLCANFQDLTFLHTGNNVAWLWNFGDGSPINALVNPSHCYTNNSSPASYTITLTVTSDSGCVSVFSKNNYIAVYPNPIADFSSSNVCFGTSVTFTNSSTIPTNDTIQSWAWDFGDSSQVNTNQTITGGHLYALPNNYNVELVAVSGFGCLDTIVKTVTVSPNPFVNFSTIDTVGCEPLCISFQNLSSVVTGTTIQYVWNVGDGSPASNSQSFDHCYINDSVFAPAYFNVTLTVTSDSGCISTLSKNNYITVYPRPDARFTAQPHTTTITNPVVSITNSSIGANYFNWNFRDQDTSSLFAPPSHTYADTGIYTIVLITSTTYNCVDTAYQTIVIEPDFTFFIPNAFTPNDDGINDSFSGKGIFIKEFEMTIFDRWGNLIYKTSDINKPWDGKANHGNEIAQAEVYVYDIQVTDLRGGKHKYKGVVTLLR
jgi:gliding motility-associated-like protein